MCSLQNVELAFSEGVKAAWVRSLTINNTSSDQVMKFRLRSSHPGKLIPAPHNGEVPPQSSLQVFVILQQAEELSGQTPLELSMEFEHGETSTQCSVNPFPTVYSFS